MEGNRKRAAQPYKIFTLWIFAALVVVILLLFVFPTAFVIGLAVGVIPILVILQALLILRAKEESKHRFDDDDRWYDNP